MGEQVVSEEDKAKACSLKDEGNKLFKAGNHLKAAGLYAKASKVDPSNHVLFSNLAAALLGTGHKFSQALSAADKALVINPDFAKSHFRRGVALAGLEREEEAIVSLRRAVELDPANTSVPAKITECAKQVAERCTQKGEAEPAFVQQALSDALAMQSKADALSEAKAKENEEKAKVRQEEEKVRAKKKAAEKKAKAEAEKLRLMKEESLRREQFEEAQRKAEEAGETFLASEPVAENEGTSSVKELYEAKCRMMKGILKPYSSQRVNAFTKAEVTGLLDPALRHQFAAPIAIVLPGRVQEDWGDEGSGVAIHSAFDTPDNHKEVIAFLRQHAVQTEAHAILLVVRKSLIAYPRVWISKEWPFGDKDGYFVQLETCDKKDRKLWFMEVGVGGVLTEHEIDFEKFRVCQTLLRDVAELATA